MNEKSQSPGGSSEMLEEILTIAKRHGVSRLKYGSIEVEFFKQVLPIADNTAKLTEEELQAAKKKQEELDLYWSAN